MPSKIHRIGKTKTANESHMLKMAENLKQRLKCSVFIKTQAYISGYGTDNNGVTYQILLLPGLNSSECTEYTKRTWEDLFKTYRALMKQGRK